jgi:hypothetical protein
MAIERTPRHASQIDILDRILDRGIVIDAWARLSLVGIDLLTVEGRIVVASIETHLNHSYALGAATSAARPAIDAPPVRGRWVKRAPRVRFP